MSTAVPSEVRICNLAISLVGGRKIASLRPPDDTVEGTNCYDWFDHLRDAIQRSFQWSCCTTRIQLTAAASAAPSWGYTYQYPLQDKYLRVLRINGDSNYDWRVEAYNGQRHLLTNWANPQCYVIERNTTPAYWDDLLVNAMVHRLASALAWPVTKNAAMADGLLKAANAFIEEAREVDSQEGAQEFVEAGELIDVRHGYETPLYGYNVD